MAVRRQHAHARARNQLIDRQCACELCGVRIVPHELLAVGPRRQPRPDSDWNDASLRTGHQDPLLRFLDGERQEHVDHSRRLLIGGEQLARVEVIGGARLERRSSAADDRCGADDDGRARHADCAGIVCDAQSDDVLARLQIGTFRRRTCPGIPVTPLPGVAGGREIGDDLAADAHDRSELDDTPFFADIRSADVDHRGLTTGRRAAGHEDLNSRAGGDASSRNRIQGDHVIGFDLYRLDSQNGVQQLTIRQLLDRLIECDPGQFGDDWIGRTAGDSVISAPPGSALVPSDAGSVLVAESRATWLDGSNRMVTL